MPGLLPGLVRLRRIVMLGLVVLRLVALNRVVLSGRLLGNARLVITRRRYGLAFSASSPSSQIR